MATTSNSRTGAASAAPTTKVYVDLEAKITRANDDGIRARWQFGRELLKERGTSKQLPKGRIAQVCVATGRGRTEILFRVKFAERYPTEAEVSNAIGHFGSWYGICKKGLYEKRATEPKPEPQEPKRRPPTEGGKRRAQLHRERQQGRPESDLYHMQQKLAHAAAQLEYIDLDGFAWSEWTQDLIEYLYEDILRVAKWTEHALNVTQAHMGDLSRQRTHLKLVARSNDASSTQNERIMAAKAAEKLRPKLGLNGN